MEIRVAMNYVTEAGFELLKACTTMPGSGLCILSQHSGRLPLSNGSSYPGPDLNSLLTC